MGNTQENPWLKKRTLQRMAILAVLAFFLPRFMLFMVICGLLDILRNDTKDAEMFRKYFFGSGTITWVLAPMNLLFDLLSLPYWNKGVYRLEDLPPKWQEELGGLLETMEKERMVERLEPRLTGTPREMIFFKWYGQNLETPIDVPAFHAPYKYISTIGISVFNQRQSTNKHFGPFRITFRVLDNINKVQSEDVYIDVGSRRHYWKDDPLFIFDDTFYHQSINESDAQRYCAFIDIVRPTLIPGVLRGAVSLFGAALRNFNHVFYNAWTFVK
jgi:beta-hydroxylase